MCASDLTSVLTGVSGVFPEISGRHVSVCRVQCRIRRWWNHSLPRGLPAFMTGCGDWPMLTGSGRSGDRRTGLLPATQPTA